MVTNTSVRDRVKPSKWFEDTMDAMKLQYFGHIMRKNNILEKTDYVWTS